MTAKDSSGNNVGYGGNYFVVEIYNQWTLDSSNNWNIVSGAKQTVSSTIKAQMTDNGDGTYSYSYSVQNDGAISIVIRMYTNSGISCTWYDNQSFSGSPALVNTISTINVVGPPTYSSSYGTSDSAFTAILSTKIKSPITGTLSFNIIEDNGWNLWFDGVQKTNSFDGWGTANEWFSVSVTKDQYYDLLIRWINGWCFFNLILYWQGGSISNQVVPSTAFFQEAMVTSSPIQITVSWPTGYTSGQPSYTNVWHELWGDGIRVGSEKCDDGNLVNNDGCQADCIISTGFVWAGGTIVVKDTCVYWTTGLYPNAAQTQWIPHWADSRRAGSEACDDGNLVDGDGCSSSWTIESGYSCSGGSVTSKDTWAKWDPGYIQDISNPSKWITVCGDGLRAGSEKWDDANTSSGDGCKGDWSSVESGCVCFGGTPTSQDTWK